jgi:hypothetical protein
MKHRTRSVVAAMLVALTPGLARGGGPSAAPVPDVSVLSEEVATLAAMEGPAAAARLAAAGAARLDLDADARVLLGGLARENYELSFAEDHKLVDLCKLAAVMRLVAPLDSTGGAALKLAAAADAEAQLAELAGEEWPQVCELASPGGMASKQAAVADTGPVTIPTATLEPPRAREDAVTQPASPVDRAKQRRVRAGLAMLIPGILLFAPMAGLLSYRRQGERDLQALWDGSKGPTWNETEHARANALDQRHRSTTAVAAVLGATGAALVVAGAILAATGGRRSQVAVAPWGSRGAGGLFLEGRF